MFATALLALAMTVSKDSAAACPPSSQSCPLVLTDATGAWGRSVKPSRIDLGAGTPFIYGLRWTAYNGTEAVATGRAAGIRAGCEPLSSCPVVSVPVTVTMLHAAKGGRGRWYFTRMHVAGRVAQIGVLANSAVTPRGYWS